MEIALLRVAQEALANARKHSGADTLRVELEFAEDAVRLRVRDNGSGFDVDGAYGGYGLTGIRERMDRVNGTVEITSTRATGSTVAVEVTG